MPGDLPSATVTHHSILVLSSDDDGKVGDDGLGFEFDHN